MLFKKTFLILFVLALTSFKTADNNTNNSLADKVFVCGKSKIYHKSDSHNALGNCKSGIAEMTEKKAKDKGLRVCKCKY